MKINFITVDDLLMCPLCGVHVIHEDLHTIFHKQLSQIKDIMDTLQRNMYR